MNSSVLIIKHENPGFGILKIIDSESISYEHINTEGKSIDNFVLIKKERKEKKIPFKFNHSEISFTNIFEKYEMRKKIKFKDENNNFEKNNSFQDERDIYRDYNFDYSEMPMETKEFKIIKQISFFLFVISMGLFVVFVKFSFGISDFFEKNNEMIAPEKFKNDKEMID